MTVFRYATRQRRFDIQRGVPALTCYCLYSRLSLSFRMEDHVVSRGRFPVETAGATLQPVPDFTVWRQVRSYNPFGSAADFHSPERRFLRSYRLHFFVPSEGVEPSCAGRLPTSQCYSQCGCRHPPRLPYRGLQGQPPSFRRVIPVSDTRGFGEPWSWTLHVCEKTGPHKCAVFRIVAHGVAFGFISVGLDLAVRCAIYSRLSLLTLG